MARYGTISSLTLILSAQLIFAICGEVQAIELDLSDGFGLPGGTASVEIILDKNAEPVSGIAMDIAFDTDVLSNPRAEIEKEIGSGTDTDRELISGESSPGVFRIGVIPHSLTQESLEATIPEGLVATVTFDINLDAILGDTTSLTNTPFCCTAYSEDLPVDGTDGKVSICTMGDVNGDGGIGSDDAMLALGISVGTQESTLEQKCAADMNGDGKISSVDALLILRNVVTATPGAYPILSSGGAAIISLSETRAVAGESMTVPLRVDSVNGLAGGDIWVTYDSEVLRATDILSNADMLLARNIAEPGTIRIAFACSGRLNANTLAEIQFDVLADSVSAIEFQRVELYRPDASPISLVRVDGKFTSWAVPPEHSALLQNFPNPFNPDTWMPYQLKEGGEVTLQILSVAGELTRELKLGYRSPGLYISRGRAAYWDGKNEVGEQVSSGVYFYTIQAGDFTATGKMTVAK